MQPADSQLGTGKALTNPSANKATSQSKTTGAVSSQQQLGSLVNQLPSDRCFISRSVEG